MERVKAIIVTVSALLMMFSFLPAPAHALQLFQLEGGIANEQEYREILFITGEPILITGKVKETKTERDGTITHRFSFTNLENPEKKVKVSRSLTFVTTTETRQQQTVSVTRLTNYSESITVDKDKYSLIDYQFSHSAITDRQPVVAYTSGNWNARKTYSLNKNAAKIVVETWGNTVGYDQSWGSTDTVRIDGTISFDGKVTVDKTAYDSNWAGAFQENLSHSRARSLSFQENEPTQISFSGGYLESEQETGTLQYTYNLPKLDRGLVVGARRNQGSGAQQLSTLPRQKRLPVALQRDIQGHWAEDDIMKLVGLGAFPAGGEYFGPRLPMLRGDFARALVTITNLKLPEPPPKPGNTRTPPPPEQSIYADVPIEDPSYRYYQAVTQAGIMQGTGPALFDPDKPLTRAQAITIIIRALGLEGMAPVGSYQTAFLDDRDIPRWARDAVYVGSRIGLVKGDDYGYVLPNQVMSRAEAAAFLSRFIRYLQAEMKAEYRERILNYR